MKRIYRISRIWLKGRMGLTKVISKRITYDLILWRVTWHISNSKESDIKLEHFYSLLESIRQNYIFELEKLKFAQLIKAYKKN